MLDKEAKQIDAVTVGTPDHIHAVASMAAIRAGKHVYCQKPLTHTLHECRELTKAGAPGRRRHPDGKSGARHRGRPAHQRVDPGRASSGPVQRGSRLVGPGRPAVETGHRPPHGHASRPEHARLEPLARADPRAAVSARRMPRCSWRGWWDFGTGALGDMGCHIIDHPVWALEARAAQLRRGPHDHRRLVPRWRQAQHRDLSDRRDRSTYEFPARGDLPPVRMTWYDGGLMPPAPAELPAGERLPDNGVLYIGSKGKMYPRLSRRHAAAPAARPPRRGRQGHQDNRAIARPLRRMGRRLQGRSAPGLQLRLRRPTHRDHAAGRSFPQGARAVGSSGTART